MKKIYSLLAAVICVGGINAQTLTQANHAPIVGDVYQTVDCNTVGITPGGNGTGQTWNFSAMTVLSNTVTNTGVTVASTGSASSYPSAGLAIQSGTPNLFYSSNTSSLSYWGGDIKVGGQTVTMSYTSPAIYASYPMVFGTTAMNNIGGSLNSIAGPGSFSGTSTVTASGVGTLMLPGGYNFNNVLKVTTLQAMTFTLSLTTGTYTQSRYDYYSPLSKYPLVTITNEYLSTTLAGTTTETVVTINNNYKTVGIAESANQTLSNVSVYPNPAKDNININFVNENAENASYEIVNVLGQTVRAQNIPAVKGETLYNVNLAGIDNGVYFVKLNVGNKTSIKKITVQ